MVKAMSVAKRLAKVERGLKANRPEMQTKTYTLAGTITGGTASVTDITAVSQGDAVDNRSGDRIKLWRVEVRGTADSDLDLYIIKGNGAVAPVLANFTSANGAYLLDSENGNQFIERKHYRNLHAVGSEDPVKFSVNFKGMQVKYNGTASTAGIQNKVYFVVVSRNTADSTASLSCRIWFTDP